MVCAMVQVVRPMLYAPDHGWLATSTPTVAKRRFGVIEAASGQLRYPVIRASTYPWM